MKMVRYRDFGPLDNRSEFSSVGATVGGAIAGGAIEGGGMEGGRLLDFASLDFPSLDFFGFATGAATISSQLLMTTEETCI
jgi:hypothetical protein